MDQEGESFIKLLASGIRLAKDVLRECQRTKVIDSRNLWAFALLGRLAAAADAARTLILSGHGHSAKLIIRSMLDAFLDLNYVIRGPLKLSETRDFLLVETCEDQFEGLEFLAAFQGKNLKHFADRFPGGRQTLDEYNKAKKDHRWHNRWRHIRRSEKLKWLPSSGSHGLRHLWYTAGKLGDAVAHSRSAALKAYMKERAGKLRFTTREPQIGLFDPGWLAAEALVWIILACDVVIDEYYLDERLSRRLTRIAGRWRKVVPARSQ